MKIVIDIPKEFETHFEIDRFEDSLCRLIADAHSIAGNYEKEVANMLIDAFRNCTPLPKGHGRLIDADALKNEWKNGFHKKIVDALMDDAPTIIEADTGEEE